MPRTNRGSPMGGIVYQPLSWQGSVIWCYEVDRRMPSDPVTTWPRFVPLPRLQATMVASVEARRRIRDAWRVLRHGQYAEW